MLIPPPRFQVTESLFITIFTAVRAFLIDAFSIFVYPARFWLAVSFLVAILAAMGAFLVHTLPMMIYPVLLVPLANVFVVVTLATAMGTLKFACVTIPSPVVFQLAALASIWIPVLAAKGLVSIAKQLSRVFRLQRRGLITFNVP